MQYDFPAAILAIRGRLRGELHRLRRGPQQLNLSRVGEVELADAHAAAADRTRGRAGGHGGRRRGERGARGLLRTRCAVVVPRQVERPRTLPVAADPNFLR
ncbi:hypothetical protein QJS66_10895 [Kocuria rhizophila]|nr:hypothetical protein QJS66_10895 [Kocuria rhizophila]